MSTPITLKPSAGAELPRPRAPWPVVAAFYLWWVLIFVQSVGLAWMGLVFGQAAEVGGPAWDILFVYVPIGLPTLALVVIEVILVLRLRRAGRVARVVLAILALPAALTALNIVSETWWAAQAAASSVSFVGPNVAGDVMFWVAIGILIVAAIAAAILPFLPPVGRYFRKTPGTDPPPAVPEFGAAPAAPWTVPELDPLPAEDPPPFSER
ncbi:hypothetical protein ACFVSU_19025 [Microbacterium sp. NPDC058062]|uniref:hypothetical protein n=1 Tax=Microbacterium sp. NPDC058062 TaxID=3346320 RepID=UPI0036DF64DC